MPSEVEMSMVTEMSAERLGWVRGLTHMLVESMTDDQLVARAGGKGNHALWIMGHLASADAYFLEKCAGITGLVPEGFHDRFGGGSEPSDARSDYPSVEELTGLMGSTRERLVEWFSSLSEEELAAPMPEELRGFVPDVRTLLFTIALHESMHAGQIMTIRSSLGMPRVIG